MSGKEDTHITVELFNGCHGTCHGCMLSPQEREQSNLAYKPEEFLTIIESLKDYSKVTGCSYRPEFSFGDFVSLNSHVQQEYLELCLSNGLSFGFTSTLAEQGKSGHYKRSLKNIERLDSDSIINLTIDPFRALNNKEYLDNIRYAIHEISIHKHLQILLSTSVIDKFSPDVLADFCLGTVGVDDMLLGFTPTLENLNFRVYNYSVSSAVEYASAFYKSISENSVSGRDVLSEEVSRFLRGTGRDYAEFLRNSFYIGTDFDIFPMVTTIYGDIFLDSRNNAPRLGNLKDSSLDEILSTQNYSVIRMSKHNDLRMYNRKFDCESCDFFESCKFNGVGFARKHYSIVESKLEGCYGPKSILS